VDGTFPHLVTKETISPKKKHPKVAFYINKSGAYFPLLLQAGEIIAESYQANVADGVDGGGVDERDDVEEGRSVQLLFSARLLGAPTPPAREAKVAKSRQNGRPR